MEAYASKSGFLMSLDVLRPLNRFKRKNSGKTKKWR
jgi:hypothetical protein